MKYIITKTNEVLIFSESINHKDMCDKKNAKSAGFLYITDDGELIVGGDSYTLGIASHPDDTELIRIHLSIKPMGL